MTDHHFTLRETPVVAMPSGALWLPKARALCVSDLHLGKSGRIARRSGTMLPPYETIETLSRLANDIARMSPKSVICLGDSFDDIDAAADLSHDATATIAQMQAGRNWVWIEGNHDPGPVNIGGAHLAELSLAGLHFRHIATDNTPEVSGHYHPKFGLAGTGPARACFLYDDERLMMPAYGTYTGGLHATDPAIRDLFGSNPIAVLTGRKTIALPVTRNPQRRRKGGRSY